MDLLLFAAVGFLLGFFLGSDIEHRLGRRSDKAPNAGVEKGEVHHLFS